MARKFLNKSYIHVENIQNEKITFLYIIFIFFFLCGTIVLQLKTLRRKREKGGEGVRSHTFNISLKRIEKKNIFN